MTSSPLRAARSPEKRAPNLGLEWHLQKDPSPHPHGQATGPSPRAVYTAGLGAQRQAYLGPRVQQTDAGKHRVVPQCPGSSSADPRLSGLQTPGRPEPLTLWLEAGPSALAHQRGRLGLGLRAGAAHLDGAGGESCGRTGSREPPQARLTLAARGGGSRLVLCPRLLPRLWGCRPRPRARPVDRASRDGGASRSI